MRYEARGPQRGGGPPLHHRLHRRGGRHGGRCGGRPRDALLPKRAGQPPVRRGGQAPYAGARRQPGMRRLHRGGLPPFGGIRHPGAAAPFHQGEPLPKPGGDKGAAGAALKALPEGPRQICDDAGERQKAAGGGGRPDGRPGKAGGDRVL